MNNPRLATRYAKSLIDLAKEQDRLDAIYNDMRLIQNICKSNPDFVAVLRSPVIKADKKGKIIGAVLQGKINELTTAFIRLLVNKNRESEFPEIAGAFIEQYNSIKDIHKVKITTAVPVSDEIKNVLIAKVKNNFSINNVELETAVDEKLIGGFVLEAGDRLIDASILKDLKDVKRQFKNNDYIHRIR